MTSKKLLLSLVLMALAACSEPRVRRSPPAEDSPFPQSLEVVLATDPALTPVVDVEKEEVAVPASPRVEEVALDCTKVSTAAPVSKLHLARAGGPERVERILRAYRCRHPDRARLYEIGRSHLNKPLLALFIGSDVEGARDRPTMLLNGGHHGSEFLATLFVLDAIGMLLEDETAATQRMLDELSVVAVPLVNPDGNHLTAKLGLVGRKNGRDLNGDGVRGYYEGVDLNRNYPFRWGALGEKGSRSQGKSQYYRGPSAASEPETQAMMRLAESERFAGAISFHTGTLAILPPYTIPGVTPPTPDVAWGIANEIAAQAQRHPEGRYPVRKNLYPVDGTDQDWLFATYGTMALLVEGAGVYGHQPPVRRAVVRGVRKTWQVFFDRFLDGPAITGMVTDAVGTPLEAEVSIDEIVMGEGERWTSRCRDGRFSRFLPGPGRYTLRIRGDHVDDVVRVVDVDGLEEVKIRLPFVAAAGRSCPSTP